MTTPFCPPTMSAQETVTWLALTREKRSSDKIAWIAEYAFRSFYLNGSLDDWSFHGTDVVRRVCAENLIDYSDLNQLIVKTHAKVNGRNDGRGFLRSIYLDLKELQEMEWNQKRMEADNLAEAYMR